MFFVVVNENVGRLWRADFVEIDSLKFVLAAELFALRRFGITAVVEAIALPRHARILHPSDFIVELPVRRNFHHAEQDPVRTAL